MKKDVKSDKLYRVFISCVDTTEGEQEVKNVESKTVVAKDVESAMKKVRLRKTKTTTEFISEVVLIMEVDIK